MMGDIKRGVSRKEMKVDIEEGVDVSCVSSLCVE
jgi:hypothetical protein